MCTEDSTVTIFKNYVVIDACTCTAGTLNKNTGPLISIDDIIIDELYDNIDDAVEIEEGAHSRKKRGTTAYNSNLAGCGGTYR